MQEQKSFTMIRSQCPSCANILGDKEESYKRLVYSGLTPGEAMDKLGIENFCCRTRILTPYVIPTGYSLEDKDSTLNLMSRNKRKDFRNPLNGILYVLQTFNGKDVITTVTPAEDLNKELLREYSLKNKSNIMGEGKFARPQEGFNIIEGDESLGKANVSEILSIKK